MVIEDKDYLQIMREEDTKSGMSGSYLQRTCKALEIIAENLIVMKDIIVLMEK